jgi:predicted LPLAT superfamily acyltransferase
MTDPQQRAAAAPAAKGWIRLIDVSVRSFGRWSGYLLVQPLAAFQMALRPRQRRAVVQYLRRLFGPRGYGSEWVDALHIFYQYACALVDRALLGSLRVHVVASGDRRILEEARRGDGVLLLGSHCGNWEVAAAVLPSLGVPLSVVMVRDGADPLSRSLSERLLTGGPEILEQGNELLGLALVERLQKGGIVAIKGDRAVGTRALGVPLLGAEAQLPVGPFVLAALSGAPVMLVHCFREGWSRYRLVVDPPRRFRFDRRQDKDLQLRRWMRWYAARLGEMARRYPHQWFNVDPLWSEPSERGAGPEGSQS